MLSWKDIQPDGPNSWNFAPFQKILDIGFTNKKMVRFSINVGPDSPSWLYTNGVPLVQVIGHKDKHDKFDDYPYYLDP
jgi:hypothetical protein